MSELKLTVALTNVNAENMSRHDLLDWVNKMVDGNFKKIEELCSGVAYCQMMNLIKPNCINLKRVKMGAKLEHEYLHNLKLFQDTFTRLKLDKTIPIERLIKKRFQDNLEFLQWFKKFFDSQAPGLENMKSMANAVVPKKITPHAFAKPETNRNENGDLTGEDLSKELEQLNLKADTAVKLRDEYYAKLRKIEDLANLELSNNRHVAFCKRIFAVFSGSSDDDESEDLLKSADGDGYQVANEDEEF